MLGVPETTNIPSTHELRWLFHLDSSKPLNEKWVRNQTSIAPCWTKWSDNLASGKRVIQAAQECHHDTRIPAKPLSRNPPPGLQTWHQQGGNVNSCNFDPQLQTGMLTKKRLTLTKTALVIPAHQPSASQSACPPELRFPNPTSPV